MDPKTQADLDNHANQLNPNNDEYYDSRGVERDDNDESTNNNSEQSD